MKLKLPDSIASTQDLNSVLDELRNFEQWQIHENTKKKQGSKHTSEPPILSIGSRQLLDSQPESIDDLIKSIEEYSYNAPNIHITLAAPAPTLIRNNIVNWCRKNIEPNILVNLQFNSSILGGMVVRYGSKIHDLSFRRKIKANQNRLLEILSDVR